MRKFYTTLEAAKICGVSQGSIIRWIHDGKILAAVTPGGHHRIEEGFLNQFLQRLNMPLSHQRIQSNYRILLIGSKPNLQLIGSWLTNQYSGSQLEESSDYFSAGWRAAHFLPNLIIVDVESSDILNFKIPRLSSTRFTNSPPFLLLTSDPACCLLKSAPAWDRVSYLLKPLDRERFLHAVAISLEFSQEIDKTGS